MNTDQPTHDWEKSGVRLRPATEADRGEIAEVWHNSASLPGVGPPIIPTLRQFRQRVDVELAAGWSVTVAVHKGDVVGFVAIRPREAVLNELFVRPEAIGSGVGGALLAHAKIAMPDGFTLFTRSSNARARRFYEKAGLIVLREAEHPRTGEPVIYYGWNV